MERIQRDAPPGEQVLLNIYDLHWTNEYTSALGLGVFHSGLEVYGIEFGYGGHPFPFTGVFEMVPKCPDELGDHFSFRETVVLGRTSLTENDIRDIVESISPRFLGDQYHLLRYNCNHFTGELSQIVCGSSIPGWINRLANMASSVPFVERALPKEWLTPCGLQTMASTNVGIAESNRQQNGSIESDLFDTLSVKTNFSLTNHVSSSSTTSSVALNGNTRLKSTSSSSSNAAPSSSRSDTSKTVMLDR